MASNPTMTNEPLPSRKCGHDPIHLKQYPSRKGRGWQCLECVRIRARERRRAMGDNNSDLMNAAKDAKAALRELRAWMAVERSRMIW